jgi:hypothetical protein
MCAPTAHICQTAFFCKPQIHPNHAMNRDGSIAVRRLDPMSTRGRDKDNPKHSPFNRKGMHVYNIYSALKNNHQGLLVQAKLDRSPSVCRGLKCDCLSTHPFGRSAMTRESCNTGARSTVHSGAVPAKALTPVTMITSQVIWVYNGLCVPSKTN